MTKEKVFYSPDLDMHVATTGRSELLPAPLARVELGHVVDCVDVSSHIRGSGDNVISLFIFVTDTAVKSWSIFLRPH